MTTAESTVRPHTVVPESTDRRAHDRAHLAAPVLVDSMSTWQRARCENVSPGGLALWCEGPLPADKTVEVYFELPSGVAIETRARVVRQGGGFVALRFVELDRRSEIALRVHCRESRTAA